MFYGFFFCRDFIGFLLFMGLVKRQSMYPKLWLGKRQSMIPKIQACKTAEYVSEIMARKTAEYDSKNTGL